MVGRRTRRDRVEDGGELMGRISSRALVGLTVASLGKG